MYPLRSTVVWRALRLLCLLSLSQRARGQIESWPVTGEPTCLRLVSPQPPIFPPRTSTTYRIDYSITTYMDYNIGFVSYEYTYVTYHTTLVPEVATRTLPQRVTATAIADWHSTGKTTYSTGCPVTNIGQEASPGTARSTRAYYASDVDTHLAATVTAKEDLPEACSADTEVNRPDPVCEELGMDTACLGQCELDDAEWDDAGAVFKCIKSPDRMNPDEGYLGRVCWGGGSNYTAHQLLEPCQVGDHWVGCTPGLGWNEDFRAVDWIRAPE